MTDGDPDSAAMQRYASGEDAAFEGLYRKYQPRLYRYFLSSTGSEAVALDLYQETWMRVIRSRATYTPQSRFLTWVFTIAKNCLTEYYRAISRPAHVTQAIDIEDMGDEQHVTDSVLSPEESALLVQYTDQLYTALETLPQVQRDAVLFRYAAGMTISEIADLMNEKSETVKSRLRYALPKLRSMLRESLQLQELAGEHIRQ